MAFNSCDLSMFNLMAYSRYSVSKTKRESGGRVKNEGDRQPMSSLGETHIFLKMPRVPLKLNEPHL